MQKAGAGKKPGNQSGSKASWGEGDDGGWSRGPPATGSGWTEPDCAAVSENGEEIGTWHNPPESSWSVNKNEIIVDSRDKEAWPSIRDNSESTSSENGDADNCSVKSGSVISSSSNTGQCLSDLGQGSSAIHGPSASSIWGTSNSGVGPGPESNNAWGMGSTSSPSATMNSMGWGNLPGTSVSVNNQGHNMQLSASSAGSDTAQDFTTSPSPFSTWGVSAAQSGSSSQMYNSMQLSSGGTGNGKDSGSKIHRFLSNGGAQVDKSTNGPLFSGDPSGSMWQGFNSGLSGSSPKISSGLDSGWSGMPSSSTSNNSRPAGMGLSSGNLLASTGNNGQSINGAGKSGNGNNSQWGSQTTPISPWGSSSANSTSGNDKPIAATATGWSNPNSGTSPNPTAGEWGSSDKLNSQWSGANSSPWGNNSAGGNVGVRISPGAGNTNPNPPPRTQPNTWAQAAGKGLNLNTVSTTSTTATTPTSSNNKSQNTAGNNNGSRVVDVREVEIQRAVESNEGWGQTPVRQDTNWEMTDVPPPVSKHKPPVSAELPPPPPPQQPSNVWNNNNGTAIWEGIKENSKPNAMWQQQQQQQRGLPPPSNPVAGSQWEHSDRNDSNTWGGGAQSSRASSDSSPGPWSGSNEKAMGTWGGNSNTQQADWSRPKPDAGTGPWAGPGGSSISSDPRSRNSTSSWGDTGVQVPGGNSGGWDDQPAVAPPIRRSMDESGTAYWGEATPQQQQQQQPPPPPPPPPPPSRPPPSNWNSPATPTTPLIPRIKPDEEPVWNKGPTKLPPPTGPPPQGPPGSCGWGDPSPPSTKVDDGTSIWAANNQHQARAGGWGDTNWTTSGAKPKMSSSSSWAEPGGGDNMNWNSNGGRKASESWPSDDGDSGWGADTDMGNWNEGGSQENNSSWSSVPGFKKRPSLKGATFTRGPGQPPQMRIKLLQQLMDMGFKKDEAQHALISNNMNIELALADLKGGATYDRKDQDIDVFIDGAKPVRKLRPDLGHDVDISDTQSDSNPYVPNISMQNTPFPNAQIPNQQQMFSIPMKPGTSLNPSSLNASNPSIPPTLQQKILQQKILNQQTVPPPPVQSMANAMNSSPPVPSPAGGIRGGGQQQLPGAIQAQSVQQQMAQQQILQQLRMAVQAGLISQQLLNQQLPPTILLMLQQLLQLQTALQQLVTKQQLLQQNKTGINPMVQRTQLEQVGLAIGKIRQQMLQQQQQIAQAQQQLLAKHPGLSMEASGGATDPGMVSLQPGDISALASSVAPQPPQSKLTQWKRQTPDKEMENSSDINLNKAVGSKSLHQSHSTPNLGHFESLNIGGDSTWSSVSTSSASPSWPAMSAIVPNNPLEEGKEPTDKESQHGGPGTPNSGSNPTTGNNAFSLNDMIHEFVPGKPWQGMIKSVEDDPHITPGSYSRSLSVNTIKDEYLNNLAALTKTSPGGDSQLASQLTSQPSSTWSVKDFPRSATGANQHSSKMWNNPGDPNVAPTTLTSELWGVPLPKSSAAPSRPPPGLSNQAKSSWGSSGIPRQQSWAGSTGGGSAFTPVGISPGWESRPPNVTVWLMLRNLTPQIDGSTLKTLCQQHGPLQFFYLNHGQALVRYSSRDEAMKAQKSLNTCILGNTTILAEFVTDTEAARFMQESAMNTTTPSQQWSQPSQPNYRSAGGGGGYANSSRAATESPAVWNHAAAAAGPPPPPPAFSSGFSGNSTMWGSNLWGAGMTSEDHGSNPLLGNLLGESM